MRPSQLAVALLVVAACDTRPSSSGGTSADAEVVLRQYLLDNIPMAVDIIAVVDDGAGTATWRDALAAELAGLSVSWALTPPRHSMRLDVGRLSANPPAGAAEPDGILRGTGTRGACLTAGGPEAYVRSECLAGNFAPSGTAGLEAAVRCIGRQPQATTRSAPLAALRKALVAPPRENLGFLQDDAYLLILMVSATDDGSTDASGSPVSVDEVVAAVKTVKPSADMIAVSVLAPPDAPRLRDFAEKMGRFVGVLGADPLVPSDLRPMNVHVEPMCLRMPLRDTSPAPGLQPLCSVYERSVGTDEAYLPSCDTAAPLCWTMQAQPLCFESGLELRVRRQDGACPHTSSVRIECAACTSPDQPGCEEMPR